MSRCYTECEHCHDLLPEWMDGTWTCECGRTTIEVDLRVDCRACGKSIKEHEAHTLHYRSEHPSGGSLETWLHFCGEHYPGLYQVRVEEAEGCLLPGLVEEGGTLLADEDHVARWLSALPRQAWVCGCGSTEDVGGRVLPAGRAEEGDLPLAEGWVFRPTCLRCSVRNC